MDIKEWMNRGRSNINLEDVAEYVGSIHEMLISEHRPWRNEDVRKAIEKKYNSENFALTGLAKIVKGDKPAIALNTKQMNVVEALWDISMSLNTILGSSYVEVENDNGQIEDAQLKWISAKIPKGSIVVSQALANKLKLQDEDRIVFSFKEQNLSNIDLDR